jgi:hypothetical protein
VDVLVAAGFRGDDVSILAPDQKVTRELAAEKNTKAPEGTTTGVVTGGALGGTLGLLAGIGALAIPGLGPFIAARGRSWLHLLASALAPQPAV